MITNMIPGFITIGIVFVVCIIIAIVREVKTKKQKNSYIKETEQEF